MDVLLTNDDGVFAEGLQALRRELVRAGFHTTVVAPDRGASGASRSLSLNRPLGLRKIAPDQYAVDGTPTDCVMMALHEIFRKKKRPAFLLSGINHGQNLADDVSYSGTCAAAFEGCSENIPSVALSALPDKTGRFFFEEHSRYFVDKLLPKIRRMRLSQWSFLNVNFPPRPADIIRGVRVVPLGRSTYTNPIARQKHPQTLGRVKTGYIYWIVGAPLALKKKGTDIEAIEQGFVSISPVRLELNDPGLLHTLRRTFHR